MPPPPSSFSVDEIDLKFDQNDDDDDNVVVVMMYVDAKYKNRQILKYEIQAY